MKDKNCSPRVEFTNEGVDVVVLDASAAQIGKTPRPVTGVRLKELKERLAREAELQRQVDEAKKHRAK